MRLPLLKGRVRYAVIGLVALLITALMATAMVSIIDDSRGGVNITEHRQFNQGDHNSICAYLRDEAVQDGRPVYPCGTDGRS